MNIFAHIQRLEEFQFKKVKYFSICFEDSSENEFYDFLNRMEDIEEYIEDLTMLLVWIEEIGMKYGAQKRLFRNESEIADVRALPPPRKEMAIKEIKVENMRLYCMVLNQHVVILFNGGIKSSKKAQDCPNVAPYFKQANLLAKKIDQLLKERDICWNYNYTDILYDEKITIEL